MEWLKNPKNTPIVGAIAGVIILVALFSMWWFVLRTPSAPEAPQDQAAMPAEAVDPNAAPDAVPVDAGAPAPAPDEAAPVDPSAAPAPAAPPAGEQVASAQPMETWRADPFLPIGYKPPPKAKVQPKPRIMDFPFMKLPVKITTAGVGKKVEKPEIAQPSRRMAGILLDDRIYAIIETNGVSQVVQPGDYTTDRLALVERIEPDKVVLKTVDDKPRYITVKMASSPIVQQVEPGVNSPPPAVAPRPGRGGPHQPYAL